MSRTLPFLRLTQPGTPATSFFTGFVPTMGLAAAGSILVHSTGQNAASPSFSLHTAPVVPTTAAGVRTSITSLASGDAMLAVNVADWVSANIFSANLAAGQSLAADLIPTSVVQPLEDPAHLYDDFSIGQAAMPGVDANGVPTFVEPGNYMVILDTAAYALLTPQEIQTSLASPMSGARRACLNIDDISRGATAGAAVAPDTRECYVFTLEGLFPTVGTDAAPSTQPARSAGNPFTSLVQLPVLNVANWATLGSSVCFGGGILSYPDFITAPGTVVPPAANYMSSSSQLGYVSGPIEGVPIELNGALAMRIRGWRCLSNTLFNGSTTYRVLTRLSLSRR